MRNVTCEICSRNCSISEGEAGFCKGRMNIGGKNTPAFYGQLSSLALDPIEKKPLYEFHPGSMILSAGFYGCNMHCAFCQNHEISQIGKRDLGYMECSPERLRDLAVSERSHGNIGLAFTYNEPLVNYEYVIDAAKLVHEAGLLNVMVTNGNAGLPILNSLLPHIDAMNIDLKGFKPQIYRELGGDLELVKSFIEAASEQIHVEVTSLIVPGMNDSAEDMERQATWLSGLEARFKKRIPLHITRFFPRYKMTSKAPTEISVMRELRRIAERYLDSVYLGNV